MVRYSPKRPLRNKVFEKRERWEIMRFREDVDETVSVTETKVTGTPEWLFLSDSQGASLSVDPERWEAKAPQGYVPRAYIARRRSRYDHKTDHFAAVLYTQKGAAVYDDLLPIGGRSVHFLCSGDKMGSWMRCNQVVLSSLVRRGTVSSSFLKAYRALQYQNAILYEPYSALTVN
jgi:hypothetical protein